MNVEIITLPKFEDVTGNVAVIEKDIIPFKIKRVFYLYDVAGNSVRGRHAHKSLLQFIVPVYGSFDVTVKDGKTEKLFTLNNPNQGLMVNTGIWNELSNFSSGAVCMVLASDIYNEDDYIRDYDAFLKYTANSL